MPEPFEWPCLDGRYLRTWTDRFGVECSRFVVVKGRRMFDAVKAAWCPLPAPADAGSWEWLGDLDTKHAVDGEVEIGTMGGDEGDGT